MDSNSKFKCCLIGDGALLIACGELILASDNEICCVVTSNTAIREWAEEKEIRCLDSEEPYYDSLKKYIFDYLFSIVYLKVIPSDVLALAKIMSINFHDALLPQYAGIHATSWAIMNGEKKHGITWHIMLDEVDKGKILKQSEISIEPQETALSLNLKCYEAGLDAFAELLEDLVKGSQLGEEQELSKRTYFSKYNRPSFGCIISWDLEAEQIDAFVRALEFGKYHNKMGIAKIMVEDDFFIIKRVRITEVKSIELPGTITECNEKYIRISTGSQDIEIDTLMGLDGALVSISDLVSKYNIKVMDRLSDIDNEKGRKITEIYNSIAPKEDYWVREISKISRMSYPEFIHKNKLSIENGDKTGYYTIECKIPQKYLDLLYNKEDKYCSLKYCITAYVAFIAKEYHLDFINLGISYDALERTLGDLKGFFGDILPISIENVRDYTLNDLFLHVSAIVEETIKNKTFAYDIVIRYPQIQEAVNLKNGFPICVIQTNDLNSYRPGKNLCFSIIVQGNNNSSWSFIYNTVLLSEGEIVHIANNLSTFLERWSMAPEKILANVSIESEDKIKQLVFKRNQTHSDYPKDKCVHQLFRERTKEDPEAVAVIFEDKQMTYKELDEKSSRLAQFLKRNNVVRGELIGLYMERDIDILVSMLGILKAGGAYVPLDPIYPSERIKYMIHDAEIIVILTQERLKNNLPKNKIKTFCIDSDWEKFTKDTKKESNKRKTKVSSTKTTFDDLAYVIYTSGSTGKPKGVEVSHRGLVNFLHSMAKEPGFTKNDRILSLTTICFDISGLEMFLPLITGGQVEILSSEVARDGFMLKEKIESGNITVVQATPATWEMLLAVEWNKKMPMKILCGGEALSKTLAQKLLDRSNELWNMYGPTETTIWSTVSRVLPGEQITIGHPIANTQIYILDESLKPVPDGVEGEIYIGGDGIARGYLNRRELTAEKFIVNPFDNDSGSKIYKTGDTGMYLPDGRIVCLGRIDNQVKLNGFRIELEEIEAVLEKHTGIRKAAVTIREDEDGYKTLVAFVIPKDVADIKTIQQINKWIKKLLPSYMIPSSLIFVEKYPLTYNLKIDRKQLSTASLDEIIKNFAYKGNNVCEEVVEESSNAYEQKLVESTADNQILDEGKYLSIKEELIYKLSKDLIDIASGIVKVNHRDFAINVLMGEYGYDSIRFTVLSMKIKEKYGIMIPPAKFYSYSTIERLIEYLLDNYAQKLSEYYGKELESVYKVVDKAIGKREITGNNINNNNFGEKENTFIINNKATEPRLDSVQLHSEERMAKGRREPVAVIGISGRFPQSPDLDILWENIVNEKDLITEVPIERWDVSKFKENENQIVSRWGGFIEDVDKFDAEFFNISPREAELMDPQQRIFIETVWKAIENAGYKPSDISGTKTAVYAGVVSSDYWDMMTSAGFEPDLHTISGNIRCVIANRISYLLNLQGASATIDTACSSSLVAIHRAVVAIQNGYCDMAIAGGVNVIISPFIHIALSKNGMLSMDGKCKTFDSNANGYVRGEGAGVVILKPLKKALEDRDYIHAIIRGSSENHGGRTNSLSVPNPNAQADLIVNAFKEAGIDPSTISYIEAHGTGTSLGDPIEIDGLKKAFNELYKDWGLGVPNKAHCALGSVKTNIGHLEASAGVAGMLKVILAMQKGVLPGLVHFNEKNSYIELEGSPFYILEKTMKWERQRNKDGKLLPRVAGINSFGFGGSNAHVVLEEYQNQSMVTKSVKKGANVFILSARNEDRLRAYAIDILGFLERIEDNRINGTDDMDGNFEGIIYTLQIGRQAMEERLAILVSSVSDLRVKLKYYIDGNNTSTTLFTGNIREIREKASLLIEGEEGDEYIKMIISNNKMEKLAQLWTIGINVNWNLLYQDHQPRRIPLPSYPFMKTRHWLPEVDIQGRVATSTGIITYIHPLLHQNTSDLSEQRYSSSFTGEEFFLTHHIVNGQKVLPGVAYLEMARAAVERAMGNEAGQAGIRLKDVVWIRPIIVGEESIQVNIGLYPEDCVLGEEDGEIGYEIYGETEVEDDARVRIYNQGRAMLAPVEEIPVLDLEEIHAECNIKILQADEVYEAFKAMGIQYGDAHKGIEQIYVGQEQVLARLSLPSSVTATKEEFILHPSIMDSALQASIGLATNFEDRALSANKANKPILPFALHELEVFGNSTSCRWAWIRSSEGSKAEDKVQKLDIDICDEQGNVCVRLKGFSTRALEGELQTSKLKETNSVMTTLEAREETYILTPVWDKVSIKRVETFPKGAEQVVMVGGTKEDQNTIKKQYPNAAILEISTADSIDDISNKLAAYGTVHHILWVTPQHSKPSPTNEALIKEQRQGVLQLFHMIKALLNLGYGTRELGFSIITNRVQAVYKSDEVNPTHASLHGLAGSMAKEYPNWKIRLIDLESNEDWPVSDIFALPLDTSGNALAYRGGEWYGQQLIPVQSIPIKQTLYKTGGVYVVIGGAGGIGEVWSEYVIRTYQAQVIWIGRRAKDENIQAKIDRLAALGPKPQYIVADATKRKALEAAYQEIKQRYSKINGVIHSAIVLLDKSLANMTEEQFQAGLSAKVDVSVRMAQVFKEEPLDFVLFFSSMQSFSKAAGQSNYAAGCTFKDAFAHWLNLEWPCSVKVMNWGYWGNVGIVASKAYQERMAQAGIGSIEPPEAMEALERLLAGSVDQIGLIKTTELFTMEGINSEKQITIYPETFSSVIGSIRNHSVVPDRELI